MVMRNASSTPDQRPTGLENAAEVFDGLPWPVGCRSGIDDTVRIALEYQLLSRGPSHTERINLGQGAGILTILRLGMDPDADKVEVRSISDGSDRQLADTPSRPDDDLIPALG